MKRVSLSIVMLSLLSFGAAGAQVQNGYDLFQQALVKERVEGDLAGAIELFERIAEEHGEDRSLVARALLETGRCFEKLGSPRAQEVYERLIRDYGDQSEPANTARDRMANLTTRQATRGAEGLTVRRVFETDNFYGSASPDGRYLSFFDYAGDLDKDGGGFSLRDLLTGETLRLTHMGPGLAGGALFSPDSRRIAYVWDHEGFSELRVIGIAESEPRLLYRNPEVAYFHLEAWSGDGKTILAVFARQDQTHQIVLISTVDGSARVLKSLDWRYPTSSLSPDGTTVAYSSATEEGSPENDIFLLSTDGTWETALVQHPADDRYPIWTPDGERIVFWSDRGGTIGAWVMRVGKGGASAPAELVKADLDPRSQPMGFRQDGSLFFRVAGGTRGPGNVFVARLDSATGRILGRPTQLSRQFVNTNTSPDWSHDGKSLAYISRRDPGFGGSRSLIIRSLDSDLERSIELDLIASVYAQTRWSPDGQAFLIAGFDEDRRRGIQLIDAQTGATLTRLESELINSAEWSADGGTVFYSTRSGGIVRWDPETGREQEIYSGEIPLSMPGQLAVSPDGQQLAFLALLDSGELELSVVSVSGGNRRILVTLSMSTSLTAARLMTLAWDHDGGHLLFTRSVKSPVNPNDSETAFELWRVPSEGGEPQQMGLTMDLLREIRVSPGGEQIAFTAGNRNAEVWIMEHFLSR